MEFHQEVMFIRQRYALGVIGLFIMACEHSQRTGFSMTLIQMVAKVKTSHIQIIGETCPDDSYSSYVSANSTHISDVNKKERYDWSQSTQGLLLSASHWGYMASHVPGGLIAEKFGGKWVLCFGVLVTSVTMVLTPWAVNVGEAVGLFIIRVLNGFGQGVVTPAIMTTLSHWVPFPERSLFGALVFGGGNIGSALGSYLSGLIMANGGDWANVYYCFAVCGFIGCLLWVFFCSNTPEFHPFISDRERSYLKKTVVARNHQKKDPVPFRAMLRSPSLWALVVAYVGQHWGQRMISTVLPKYFSDVLKFNIEQTGQLSALPSIAKYISCFIFAGICDYSVKKNWHSITTGRKLYLTIMCTGAGISIMLASYSGCNRPLAVGFFIAATAFKGAFYVSVKINAMDLAPNNSGTCSAVANGISQIFDISPYIFGLLTPDQTVKQWRSAFWVSFGVLIFTNAVYLIWGSGEQQWWDDVDKHGYPANWKHGPLKKRFQAQEAE